MKLVIWLAPCTMPTEDACSHIYILFMLACLQITFKRNHELNSFRSNTTDIGDIVDKARKEINSMTTYYLYTVISGRLSHSKNVSDPTIPLDC